MYWLILRLNFCGLKNHESESEFSQHTPGHYHKGSLSGQYTIHKPPCPFHNFIHKYLLIMLKTPYPPTVMVFLFLPFKLPCTEWHLKATESNHPEKKNLKR